MLTENSPLAITMPHVKLNHQVRNDADVVLILGSRIGETDWWGKPPYWRHPVGAEDHPGRPRRRHDRPQQAGRLRHRPPMRSASSNCWVTNWNGAKGEIKLDARQARVAGYAKTMKDERAGWDKALGDMAIPMHPAHIGAVCRELFPRGLVLVADGGNATIWAMFYHKVTVPNTVISTFKFGMLGAGMSQSVAAAIARPGKPVCCIIGDGAMGFHSQEVETAVRNKAQVIYIVLCDKQWGMVKMNQQFMLRPFKTMIFKHLDPDETIKADLGEIDSTSWARPWAPTASASPIRRSSSRRCNGRWRPASAR